MTTRHSVPALLVTAQAEFSALLRASNSKEGTYSRGISLYRKIIRENISGVLERVFPLFCQRLNDSDIRDLVDAFVHQHHANQPEFHQVATELLLFIRQKTEISPRDLALIEYEWLIYAIEIDDGKVPPPKEIRLQPQQINLFAVKLNPTLKIVALPFWLDKGEPCYEDAPYLHYYVIYRKYNNALYQKKLSQTEVQLLSEMNKKNIEVGSLQEKAELYLPAMPFYSWLEANNNDELVSLTLKG